MDLLSRIILFLRRTGMAQTRFGRSTVNDPRFVRDLLQGRQPRLSTCAKVHAWLDLQGVPR